MFFQLSLILICFAFNPRHHFSPEMCNLTDMNLTELDNLYEHAHIPLKIPDGIHYGIALLSPEHQILEKDLVTVTRHVWQGKEFHRENATYGWLDNSIFTHQMIKAKVYPGKSFYDGMPAIILDYSDCEWPWKYIRDEIRQFNKNGDFIGRVYLTTSSVPFVLNFALEAKFPE